MAAMQGVFASACEEQLAKQSCHAIWAGPALHGSCGHVAGPAPQGRPPGCTRSARVVILSPVSPCGSNYYRNRVRVNTKGFVWDSLMFK